MFKFYNPLDVSKDGKNILMDGIRFNIRESLMIKEKICDMLPMVSVQGNLNEEEILKEILHTLEYYSNNLTASDKKDLLIAIKTRFIDR